MSELKALHFPVAIILIQITSRASEYISEVRNVIWNTFGKQSPGQRGDFQAMNNLLVEMWDDVFWFPF